MSLTAGVTICIVLLLRLILRNFPKKYSYFLWSVVGFRLLCPVSFNSAFSIFNLVVKSPRLSNLSYVSAVFSTNGGATLSTNGGATLLPNGGAALLLNGSAASSDVTGATPSDVTGAAGMVADAAGKAESVAEAIASGGNGSMTVNASDNLGTVAAGEVRWFNVVLAVWLVGMALMLTYGIVSYIVMARRIRNAVWVEQRVYRSDKIDSPFVFGFFRPRIYIPEFIDGKAAEYVLLHENYHIKRCDYMIKPVAFVLLCVHWFNPLVWVAFYTMGRDMEMSCDEAVIGKLLTEQKRVENGMSENEVVKSYAYALLNCASQGRFSAFTRLGFGEMPVKGRIKNVLKHKKSGWFITAAMIILCAVVLAACGTNPKSAQGKTEKTVDSIVELDTSEAPRKWSDMGLEIAGSLYKDFTPCAANIDGKWVKALYNEGQDVLITQESGNAYGIYHGEEHISVPVELSFPTDINVNIKLVDIDGRAGLYISAYLGGSTRYQLIGLEPLTPLVDSCCNDGNDAKVHDYVKEYGLGRVWVGDDDKVHVSADFEMNSGEKYSTEFIVEDADKDNLEAFTIAPAFFETSISDTYPYSAKQDIRFRVNQGSMTQGNGYIFMSIPLEYDAGSNHYIQQGSIELYYKEMVPANWG